jgi:hypothetical protein
LSCHSVGGYLFSARKWFTGPLINLSEEEQGHTNLEKDKKEFQSHDDIEGNSEKVETSTIDTKQKENGRVEVSQVENASQ